MSQIPPISGPLADDALRADRRPSLDKKRPHEDDSPAEGRDAVRPRPFSWHPSAPVEPPLKPSQLRSIEVHSILNPPAKAPAGAAAEIAREGGAEPSSAASHQRLPSSPSVHLPSPSIHSRRLSASPGMRHRPIANPASPSARFVGAGGPYPRKTSASRSPLAQESRLGLYPGAPSSPLTTETGPGHPAPVSGNPQSVPVSIQSTPTFHSRRTSANPTPNPSSQETSPSTPVSTYSQFGRSSPAISGPPGPQSAPGFPHSMPFGSMEPAPRLPSVVGGTRHPGEETALAATSPPGTSPVPGMIPCILDLKSGSSSQAEKRKANSDASRRFRNRKRNEMQMEQKITAQQDELRKQSELLQRQAQELQVVMQERDFYRSERNFYREQVGRFVPPSQISARPASPQAFRSPLQKDREPAVWSAGEPALRAGDHAAGPPPPSVASMPPMPPGRAPGAWSSAPSAYSTTQPAHPDRGVDDQGRTLPQYPGAWSRPS